MAPPIRSMAPMRYAIGIHPISIRDLLVYNGISDIINKRNENKHYARECIFMQVGVIPAYVD